MHINEVKRKLLEGVGEIISPYGFKFNLKDKSFRKETDNGFIQIFDLIFTKKTDGIYVEPTLRLKSHRIEEIYHKVAKKNSKYFEGTKTLGNNLFKIEKYLIEDINADPDEKQQYLVEENNDIDVLIKVISEKFITYRLKYFEKSSSISSIDLLLNNNPRDISIHNWLYPMRACLGIIAAKLNNNPIYYELKQIYSEEMQEAVSPYKEEFEELLRML